MTLSKGWGRYGLRAVALFYLTALLLIPVGLIFYRAFENGFAAAFDALLTADGLHALYLTALTVVIAVPLNTIFGVACAIVLVRHNFRGKAILNGLIDIPFAVSPVVIGLSLLLVYGPVNGWVGPWFLEQGVRIIFSTPGIVLACVFVSLPFVVREVVPVLNEIGDDQEKAAATLGASGWQTFWRVTLPAIRWGVTYGIVLSTARVLGEFGAVSVVAGGFAGSTETMPLFVTSQLDDLNPEGAYTASVVLALLALATLLAMNLIRRKEPELQ